MAEDQEFDVTVPVLSGDERFQDDAEDGVDDRPQHETLLAPNPGVSSESYPVGVLKPHRVWGCFYRLSTRWRCRGTTVNPNTGDRRSADAGLVVGGGERLA
jgi:hypothetical protein